MNKAAPIGIFDSGYGGLTILKAIAKKLPEYDFIYFGDNARSPYGTRSFETVYQYTLQSINRLFSMGCNLVILACNTASAKALRSIQQHDLPQINPQKRVLGILRPTTEMIGEISKNACVGIVGTPGTVSSQSYIIEIHKFFPKVRVYQEACPMWVPLVENHEINTPGADYFVEKNLKNLFSHSKDIDTLLLACTHYPLLMSSIQKFIPQGVNIISQGSLVADSLKNYLNRHQEMDMLCSKNGIINFYTSDAVSKFNTAASFFFDQNIEAKQLLI